MLTVVADFEVLVCARDWSDRHQRHALLYIRSGKIVLHFEYMRQYQLMMFTCAQTNRRALQFSASAASAGFGVTDRFVTRAIADACQQAGLSAQLQQHLLDSQIQNQNPTSWRDSPESKRSETLIRHEPIIT